MTSITQNLTEKQPSDLAHSLNPLTQGGYEDWRADVYGVLQDAGMEHEADLWWQCARGHAVYFVHSDSTVDEDTKAVYVCEDGPGHYAKAVKMTCQLRVCPECARRETFRLLARYMPKIDELTHAHNGKYRFRKIVLTTPLDVNAPDARERYIRYFQALPKVFDILLDEGWRKHQGALVAAEFGPTGHKLHFHIMFYGQWLDNRKAKNYPLASAWKKVTGGECEVVRIYGVKSEDVKSEVIETLKYTTKFWKQDENGEIIRLQPELIPTLLSVLKGTRRIRSYGVLYNVPKPPDEPDVCPVCGCSVVRWSVTEWNIFAETGWLPEKARLYLGSDIANKSPPEVVNKGGRGSPATSESPGFQPGIPGLVDNQTDNRTSHYQ